MGGVNEKWSLRYVVGPRSIQINTVMRSVLSARHEKRAQRAHLLCVGGSGRELCQTGWQPSRALLAMTRNSSRQLLAGGMQAKALLCRGSRLFFCGCE